MKKAESDSRYGIIDSYLKAGAELRFQTLSLREQIARAASLISESYRSGGKLLTFGNGGSAADAQHVAAEFTGRFQIERVPLPAIALTANQSAITAIGNDFGFDEIFARQVRALAKPGDVVMGITTSGKSSNVLNGLRAARRAGAKTIGLCGLSGDMAELSDVLLAVPGTTTSLLQEVHIALGHLLCLLVEEELFGR